MFLTRISVVFLLLTSFLWVESLSQSLLVQPYLQDASPVSIRILWETSSGTESIIEWGQTNALGNMASGTVQTGSGSTQIHQVPLTGLMPDTRYYYRAKTGTTYSAVYDFITPALREAEQDIQIVLMSDMQVDGSNPNKFYEICHEGVMDYLIATTGNSDIAAGIDCVMIPGDLVNNGTSYNEWKNYFFTPAQDLFHHTPVYPVLGNHEYNTPTYFKYFHLPDNGTPGFEEHWWYKDISNVRIIGLDSNADYLIQAQLDWLEAVLDSACIDPMIDFVFAQLHHPHHSELWPPGNINYTGNVIELLETFSSQCGKPSVHFYGHTHAYSRGNSRDHNHTMVNVATAGGNIDYWGEFASIDYPEHLVSQDDYGFVWAEIQAGTDPQVLIRRLSRGDESAPLDNLLRDSVLIKRYNAPPAVPEAVFPASGSVISPDCQVLFTGSDFEDPEGHFHGATQWQIAMDPLFTQLFYDQWRQYLNEYFEQNSQANDDLTNELVGGLQPNTAYYWRVRYRDRSLAWSDWSEISTFSTGPSDMTDNLLLNGGAEAQTDHWIEVAGAFESISSGQCAGNIAHSGSRLFAVGGVCESFPYAEGYQEIDLSAYSAALASGEGVVRFGGYLSDYLGTDFPQFRLDFYTAANVLISATATYGSHSGTWEYFSEWAPVPANCGKLRFVLTGTRESGTDNDSYFDDMFLQLDPEGCGTLYPPCEPAVSIVSSSGMTPCVNDIVTYQCTPSPAGAVYTWAVSGEGVILSGQGTAQIMVQWISAPAGIVSVEMTVP